MHLNVSVEIQWVEASNLASITEHEDKTKYETAWNVVKSCAGVIVPGLFTYECIYIYIYLRQLTVYTLILKVVLVSEV